MRHVDTIFSLTQRSRLDRSFRHLEHVRQAHRNFSRSLQFKENFAQNMRFCQNIPTRFWVSFFKISTFHVYSDIIWLLSHVVMILLLKGRYISRRYIHTLKMFAKATEKVLEVFEKSFSSKHEFCQNIPSWFLPNLNSYRFSWHIIWSVHCVVTSFVLTQN